MRHLNSSDFPENMLAHRDNQRYEQWNLEATARLLQKRFTRSHVWVVRPKEMRLKTFSVFSNFLEFSGMSSPEYSTDFGAWNHLGRILLAATHHMQNSNVEHSGVDSTSDTEIAACETSCSESDSLTLFTDKLPLVIVGFSKGCVVLNQFLHELETAKSEPESVEIVNNVAEMVWLDGGHSGGKDIWITQDSILKHLVDTKIHLDVHVTPYQVADPMRKWIRLEHKRFVEKVQKLGMSINSVKHYEGQERNIEMHFGILTSFRPELE